MKNIIDIIELNHENIEEVYNELKNEWVGNIDKSELDFIKNQISFVFSKTDVYDNDAVNLEYNCKLKLHEYLQRKLNWVEWIDIDYYNDYLRTKKFENPILHEYNHRQFESISKLLKNYERRYCYIAARLSYDDKIELKNDWIDHLEKLKNIQSISKYKEIVNNIILSINNDWLQRNSMLVNDYKNKTPFKVGLKFATGEAQSLYEKYKNERGHYLKICTELGFKNSDRPYFSETLPNTSTGSKNLFKNKSLLKLIYTHCNEKKIRMCEDFLREVNIDEYE